jgi:hypothetical protein
VAWQATQGGEREAAYLVGTQQLGDVASAASVAVDAGLSGDSKVDRVRRGDLGKRGLDKAGVGCSPHRLAARLKRRHVKGYKGCGRGPIGRHAIAIKHSDREVVGSKGSKGADGRREEDVMALVGHDLGAGVAAIGREERDLVACLLVVGDPRQPQRLR